MPYSLRHGVRRPSFGAIAALVLSLVVTVGCRPVEPRQTDLDEPPDWDAMSRNAEQQLTQFIENTPDHPKYTPEAMLRLSEIHLERVVDARRAQDDERARAELGKARELLYGIVEFFPDYERRNVTIYQLGFTLEELGELDEAERRFMQLINEFPGSGFVVEAWMRIGEYRFEAGRLDEAISAYDQVLVEPDSKFYQLALYKRAWALYKLDRFAESLSAFGLVVSDADTRNDGNDLRSEAIQYMAVCLAEEDWNGDGRADRDYPVRRADRLLTTQPWAFEVMLELAAVLEQLQQSEHAVAVYRLCERKWLDAAIDAGVPQAIDRLMAQ